MKTYKCRLRIMSPTVIGDVRSARGFSTASSVIAGHTIGGAINRVLLGKSYLNYRDVSKMFIASPAYPAFEEKETLPAHPFYYECKVCDGVRFSTLENNNLLQVVTKKGVKGIKEDIIALECEKHHPLKSLYPKPVLYHRLWNKVEIITVQSLLSVGMNRHTASSQYGLLYEYTAIEPGQEYWFTLCSIVNDELPDEFEVRIGRGTSRGLGRCLVKVTSEVELNFYQSPREEIALYAISPVPIELLSKNAIDLKMCAKRYGLVDVNGVLELMVVENQTMIFGKVEKNMSTGWPHGSPISRSRIDCLKAGSLILCRWKEKPSNPSKSINALRYLGIPYNSDVSPIDGLCMLHPFQEDPLKEVNKVAS